jgi:hypothetical protein
MAESTDLEIISELLHEGASNSSPGTYLNRSVYFRT